MPANLTDNYVANTYKGVLHANGEELPVSDKVQVYDGAGNATAIKIGTGSIDCLSLSAQGLTANDFKYPDAPGGFYHVMAQTSDNEEGINKLELKSIQDIFCEATAGETYEREDEDGDKVPIVQTQCGIVKSVTNTPVTTITQAAGGVSTNQTGTFSISQITLVGGVVTNLSLSNSGGAGNKNLLINAQGIVNQRRMVSGSSIVRAWNPKRYFLDRWKLQGGNSTTWSYNNNSNIATIIAPSDGVSQTIERVNIIPGAHILSWVGNATAIVRENNIVKGTKAGSSSAAINTLTVNLGGGGDVRVIFTNGSFSLPKLERGSSATSFDFREFGSELALCHRYFAKTYPYRIEPQTQFRGGAVQNHGTEPINPTAHNLQWHYPTEMRFGNLNVYSFNPLGTNNPNVFTVTGQLDSDAERDARVLACSINADTSQVHALQWTNNSNIFRTGMRIALAHYVADAEF